MTSVQAVQSVLGVTPYSAPQEIPLERQQEIVAALNAALQEFFRHAPAKLKRTTVTKRLDAPAAFTGADIATGTTVSTNPTTWDADEIGQTVRFDQDSNHFNEIVSQDSVLWPVNATCSTGTIYHDTAAFFDFSVEKIVGKVYAKNTSSGNRKVLQRGDKHLYSRLFNRSVGTVSGLGDTLSWKRIIASEPVFYGVDHVGGSRNTDSDSVFYVRVDPLPNVAWDLEMEIEQLPATLSVEDVTSATNLPLPDGRAYELFLPLFREELTLTSIWKGSDLQTRMTVQKGDVARRNIAKLPVEFATPVRFLRTQPGW